MDILKSKTEVKDRLSKETIGPIHLLRVNGYGSILYQCACGQEHDLNGKDVKRVASAKSFKVLLKCQNEYYTMIRIEGFFRKKAISEYGFHESSRENKNKNIST
tara:strand:+ start:140 stop:451 length:312 start_codon:yes stop_codon:yes gene_type:complete